MAMEFKRRLPIPMEIREEMPLSAELTAKKQAFDAEVAKVFTGEDARKVLIIGPCSADREDSVLEYMNRLAKTAEEVKDKLIIIPRVYTNKPRTKGTGYKGLLHNPDPEAPDDLLEGVKAIRLNFPSYSLSRILMIFRIDFSGSYFILDKYDPIRLRRCSVNIILLPASALWHGCVPR